MIAPVNNPSLVISYLTLRRLIGYVGIIVPFVVRFGARWWQGIPSNESISAYYYTDMRDVFTGTLVVIGALLLCYRGPGRRDNIVTNIAGLASVGIALLPMDPAYHSVITTQFPEMLSNKCYINHGPLGYHVYAVSTFFILASYLVYFRFPLPSSPVITKQKPQRNRIYRICGVVMVVSLLAIVGLKLNEKKNSIFWPETTAVVAFGVAWLTKGQAILKDA